MHAPLHGWCEESQLKPQLVPSHVAWPYCGVAHGSQLVVPQPFVLVF